MTSREPGFPFTGSSEGRFPIPLSTPFVTFPPSGLPAPPVPGVSPSGLSLVPVTRPIPGPGRKVPVGLTGQAKPSWLHSQHPPHATGTDRASVHGESRGSQGNDQQLCSQTGQRAGACCVLLALLRGREACLIDTCLTRSVRGCNLGLNDRQEEHGSTHPFRTAQPALSAAQGWASKDARDMRALLAALGLLYKPGLCSTEIHPVSSTGSTQKLPGACCIIRRLARSLPAVQSSPIGRASNFLKPSRVLRHCLSSNLL